MSDFWFFAGIVVGGSLAWVPLHWYHRALDAYRDSIHINSKTMSEAARELAARSEAR